jgi:N,N'-diacetyllegionaminate synthase
MSNVKIIAEVGVNHNGSIEIAQRLIRIAAKAGADYVKFQTFKAERVVTASAKKADYQNKHTDSNESQLEMIKSLELSADDHLALLQCCTDNGIKFLSTGFDLGSLDYLNQLGLDCFKIPSGEITNLPFLRKIASFKKPIVMSTGMSTMSEVREATEALLAEGVSRNDLIILHCNTEYPTPYEDVNLKAMVTMGAELDVNFGYSDHTMGIEVSLAAVAMGAKIIEKHITLDRNMKGPDHMASIEPDELVNMISGIRRIEQSLSGNGEKKPSNSERKNIAVARKSIVADVTIEKGERFSESNLTTKRPGHGISPMYWDEIIGKTADRKYHPDDLIDSTLI